MSDGWDWGTVPDWLQFFGSVGAVGAALVVAKMEADRARAAERKAGRLRADAQNDLLAPSIDIAHAVLRDFDAAQNRLAAGAPWKIELLSLAGSYQAPAEYNAISEELRAALKEARDDLQHEVDVESQHSIPHRRIVRRLADDLAQAHLSTNFHWPSPDQATEFIASSRKIVADHLRALEGLQVVIA